MVNALWWKMNYWNDRNFEGLRELAGELGGRVGFEGLAEYCRLREAGLRRQAFAALDVFLGEAAGWDPQKARDGCLSILELHERSPGVHQLLTQPLVARFVMPTLKAWVAAEPEEAIALTWMGVFSGDTRWYERALAVTPGNVMARRRLVDHHLHGVEYATHHLVESRLLGDLRETRAKLKRAQELLQAAVEREGFEDLVAETEFFEKLLSDWEGYLGTREGTFPEWCKARGRRYQWPGIFYYQRNG